MHEASNPITQPLLPEVAHMKDSSRCRDPGRRGSRGSLVGFLMDCDEFQPPLRKFVENNGWLGMLVFKAIG